MIELNDQTRFILGRQNYTCVTIARRLRDLGHEIKTKVEDEQAATIHWMLGLYEKYGDSWRDHIREELKLPEAQLTETQPERERVMNIINKTTEKLVNTSLLKWIKAGLFSWGFWTGVVVTLVIGLIIWMGG